MNIGVIFAGGSGKRMHTKGTPKQFLEVNGKAIIIHTLEHFEQCMDVDAVVVVCLETYIDYLKRLLKRFDISKVRKIVPGGQTGQESIYAGLIAARELSEGEDTIVLIHDGVRPLINSELLTESIAKTIETGNAITIAPVVETIIQFDQKAENIEQVLERSKCYVAKAPQTFYLKDILAAHELARQNGETFIDSATLMSAYGYTLHTVESTSYNIKITTPSDYYMLRAILQEMEQSQIYGL